MGRKEQFIQDEKTLWKAEQSHGDKSSETGLRQSTLKWDYELEAVISKERVRGR